MLLKIETGSDNPILRQKTTKIEEITPQIKRLALDMAETLTLKKGIGLAGPQVGQNLKIIRVDLAYLCPESEKQEAYQLTLINPEIIKRSWRKTVMEEGCLSLPNQYLKIKRPARVTVRGLNLENQQVEIKAAGLLAKVLQHEIDHLEGVLISDKN